MLLFCQHFVEHSISQQNGDSLSCLPINQCPHGLTLSDHWITYFQLCLLGTFLTQHVLSFPSPWELLETSLSGQAEALPALGKSSFASTREEPDCSLVLGVVLTPASLGDWSQTLLHVFFKSVVSQAASEVHWNWFSLCSCGPIIMVSWASLSQNGILALVMELVVSSRSPVFSWWRMISRKLSLARCSSTNF